jgi:hypothetical protein
MNFSDYYTYYNQIRKSNLSQGDSYGLLEVEKQIYFVFENYVKALD